MPARTRTADSNSAVIEARQVQLAQEPMRIGVPSPEQTTPPVVNLIRDGNTIVGAEIKCSCGQHVRLRFET